MNELSSPWIIDVGEADFQTVVVDASKERPVIVDFWAPWCQPCLALGPVLERVVAEHKGAVILAKLNVDEAQNLARMFRIEAIPAVKAFRNGQLVLEFEGVLPEHQLRDFVKRLLPTESEQLASSARATDDPVEAEKTYRTALAQDGNNAEVRVGLAQSLMRQNKIDEIADLLEPVGSEGELGVEAERIKAVLALRQRAREMGTEAEARRRAAANPTSPQARYELGSVLAASGQYEPALEVLLQAAEDDPKLALSKVREVMVQIFYVLGPAHPQANEYRTKLARLLY
jgi:putative thioredoxin